MRRGGGGVSSAAGLVATGAADARSEERRCAGTGPPRLPIRGALVSTDATPAFACAGVRGPAVSSCLRRALPGSGGQRLVRGMEWRRGDRLLSLRSSRFAVSGFKVALRILGIKLVVYFLII